MSNQLNWESNDSAGVTDKSRVTASVSAAYSILLLRFVHAVLREIISNEQAKHGKGKLIAKII